MRHLTLIITVIALAVAAPAIAGKGNGNGNDRTAGGSCSVGDGVVVGVGLPTDEVVNFMVTDGTGSDGWVLGYTSSGTWTVSVDPPAGPTTYEFVSRTYGPSGSRYDVFATCAG